MAEHLPDDQRLRVFLDRGRCARKSIEFISDSATAGDLEITMSGGDMDGEATTYLDKVEGRQLLELLTRWLS